MVGKKDFYLEKALETLSFHERIDYWYQGYRVGGFEVALNKETMDYLRWFNFYQILALFRFNMMK